MKARKEAMQIMNEYWERVTFIRNQLDATDGNEKADATK